MPLWKWNIKKGRKNVAGQIIFSFLEIYKYLQKNRNVWIKKKHTNKQVERAQNKTNKKRHANKLVKLKLYKKDVKRILICSMGREPLKSKSISKQTKKIYLMAQNTSRTTVCWMPELYMPNLYVHLRRLREHKLCQD